ncbi:hypothetical protein TrCOL_g9618 [Triparma columacea]|uniref:Uncharacterized protein n=1 Tax=Triparma columacea TaxID=722753 RepID=A0A9W7G8C6_9STRA|nr:hypothetical protein TrCOL_g9618 [Triparma columacea]
MIEGSQEKVKGSEHLLLFFFACASSGYVLKKGWENKDRSKYELLLHCILIITSVIPPELPMHAAGSRREQLSHDSYEASGLLHRPASRSHRRKD